METEHAVLYHAGADPGIYHGRGGGGGGGGGEGGGGRLGQG